jgi:hypothetical protein
LQAAGNANLSATGPQEAPGLCLGQETFSHASLQLTRQLMSACKFAHAEWPLHRTTLYQDKRPDAAGNLGGCGSSSTMAEPAVQPRSCCSHNPLRSTQQGPVQSSKRAASLWHGRNRLQAATRTPLQPAVPPCALSFTTLNPLVLSSDAPEDTTLDLESS